MATIAPLLPGQSNIIVSTIATPTIATTCFPKSGGIPHSVVGSSQSNSGRGSTGISAGIPQLSTGNIAPHLGSSNVGNITMSSNHPHNQHPLSVAASGPMNPSLNLGIGRLDFSTIKTIFSNLKKLNIKYIDFLFAQSWSAFTGI